MKFVFSDTFICLERVEIPGRWAPLDADRPSICYLSVFVFKNWLKIGVRATGRVRPAWGSVGDRDVRSVPTAVETDTVAAGRLRTPYTPLSPRERSVYGENELSNRERVQS